MKTFWTAYKVKKLILKLKLRNYLVKRATSHLTLYIDYRLGVYLTFKRFKYYQSKSLSRQYTQKPSVSSIYDILISRKIEFSVFNLTARVSMIRTKWKPLILEATTHMALGSSLWFIRKADQKWRLIIWILPIAL